MDSSSPATPLHPMPSPNPNPCETERRRQPESTFFRCKNQGHWSSSSLPEILCANGHGPCTAKVSRSTRNPGRIYYACPLQDLNVCCFRGLSYAQHQILLYSLFTFLLLLLLILNSSSFIIFFFFFFLLSKIQGSKCRFFEWYDQLAPGHHLSLSLSQSDYPLCSCGAGPCRLMLETSQPSAGRLYFICPITKVSLYSFDLLHHISSSPSLSLFIYIFFNGSSKTKKRTSFESLSSSTHPTNFLLYNPKIPNYRHFYN